VADRGEGRTPTKKEPRRCLFGFGPGKRRALDAREPLHVATTRMVGQLRDPRFVLEQIIGRRDTPALLTRMLSAPKRTSAALIIACASAARLTSA